MESLLDSLEQAGIPWGIVTNKPRLYATALLSRLSLLNRCPVLVCPDDVEEKNRTLNRFFSRFRLFGVNQSGASISEITFVTCKPLRMPI